MDRILRLDVNPHHLKKEINILSLQVVKKRLHLTINAKLLTLVR